MNDLSSVLNNPLLVWFILGLALVLSEFLVPGLVIVFFGLGAWAVALVLLVTDIPLLIQLLIFLAVSIASLFALRKKLTAAKSTESDLDEEIVGQLAEVVEAFSEGSYGKVRYKGALWKAQTRSRKTLQKKDMVRITGNDSIILIVEPVKQTQ